MRESGKRAANQIAKNPTTLAAIRALGPPCQAGAGETAQGVDWLGGVWWTGGSGEVVGATRA
jgi:hypothetical protein